MNRARRAAADRGEGDLIRRLRCLPARETRGGGEGQCGGGRSGLDLVGGGPRRPEKAARRRACVPRRGDWELDSVLLRKRVWTGMEREERRFRRRSPFCLGLPGRAPGRRRGRGGGGGGGGGVEAEATGKK